MTTIKIDDRSRPSNEAARLWLAADAGQCRGALGVDLGAGKLRNRPAFKTQRYVGVDANERDLRQGQELYPEAEIVVSSLEDYDMPRDIDLAVCFLVLMN